MKICFVVSVYPREQNDSEVPWLRKTVNLLRDAGHDISIYVPSFRGLRSHEIDGCRVKRFRYFFSPWETLTHDEGAPNKIHKFHYKIITLFYFFFGTIGLMRFHGKEKFDILHVHWPAPHALFGFSALLVHKAKIVLSFYTASLMLVKRYPFVKHFLRFFIKRADAVIAISTFTGNLVNDIYTRSLHIIPYGTTIFPQVKPPPLVSNYRILSVGRMIERKGFEYLIKAMPIIKEKWPDASLTIAGGGPLRETLVSLKKSLNLDSCVDIPGKVSQETLEELFAECNVFVLSSIVDSKGDTEGLGVVLIEAMTYTKPVIATDIGGITDIVIDTETGLLIPQRDDASIAEAVNSIFSDHEYAQKLGIDGWQHIQEHFSWPSVITRFTNVYTSL